MTSTQISDAIRPLQDLLERAEKFEVTIQQGKIPSPGGQGAELQFAPDHTVSITYKVELARSKS